jgi:hypothetical protein
MADLLVDIGDASVRASPQHAVGAEQVLQDGPGGARIVHALEEPLHQADIHVAVRAVQEEERACILWRAGGDAVPLLRLGFAVPVLRIKRVLLCLVAVKLGVQQCALDVLKLWIARKLLPGVEP